jgi:hypothetical protein
MITAITIENFKGISEPVRLELRPITLLFGQNSAGKSSLLHALIYAREVFERHNLDADHTLAAGEHLDLGGFRTFVHDHDLRRTIRLTFDLDLHGIDLPGVADPELDGDMDEEFHHLGYRTREVRIGVAIRWEERESRPFVAEYTVDVYDTGDDDFKRFARLICDAPGRGVRIAELDTYHPIVGGIEPVDRFSDEAWPYFHELLGSVRDCVVPVGEEGALGVLRQSDALPRVDEAGDRLLFPIAVQVPSRPAEGDNPEENLKRLREHNETIRRLVTVQRILFMFIAGPALLLRDLLKQFRYIGPLRQVPSRDYFPPRLSEPSRWANGMAGWDLLYTRSTLVDRVSRLLADPERLNLGYTLVQVEFREFESRDRLLTALQSNSVDDIEDVEGLLKKVAIRRRLLFRPIESPEVTLEPADLGVGVSQMVPGLAAALDDQPVGSATLPAQLVAIEHPELNLHPRLQAEIADVFLEGALAEATKGRIFFIETHSDAFTLRLFRRVRESHRRQSEQPPGGGRGDGSAAGYGDGTGDGGEFVLSVKPTDVAVWYVDRSSGLVSVKQILVDVEGEFVQPWPESDSLFEQDFREKYS